MGWNINIETGVDVSKNDIETAISELPENMANGFGKQSWGWSLAVDLRIRSPREIGLSGSYSISGKIAQPFADALAERLRGQGISCEVGELH